MEQLKPECPVTKENWGGTRGGRKYWWTELGLTDTESEKGKLTFWRPVVKEYYWRWIDPPVEESQLGMTGKDTEMNTNYMYKGTEIGPLEEWQKKFHESHHHVKEIRAKFDISPEHPGFDIRSELNNPVAYPASTHGFAWKDSLFHLTGRRPRFFDSPLNENCWEKSLATAKYVAMATFCGAMWGAAMCCSASLRHKDDWKNPIYSSAVVGLMYATKTGFPAPFRGFVAFALVAAVSEMWWWGKLDYRGLHGLVPPHQKSNAPLFLIDNYDWGGDDLPDYSWKVKEAD